MVRAVLPEPPRAPAAPPSPGVLGRFGGARIGKLLLGCFLGALLLYVLQKGGLPLLPAADALAKVPWWVIGAYLALLAISAYFRGVRWRLLLRPVAPVSSARALSAVLVGSAAILILPLRLGEMARPYLIARTKQVGVLAALGTVVAERIIDGLILALILGAALLTVPTLSPLPAQVVGIPVAVSAIRGYAWTFLLVFSAAFTAIVVFHSARELATKLLRGILGRFSPKLAAFVALRFESFSDGLSFLRNRAIASRYLLETAVYWFTGALSYWVLGYGTGVVHADQSVMTFGEACAVMGVLGIATVLPGPPGLLGLFQAGVYAALTMYFPERVVTGAGSAYVFLLYVLQMAFTLTTALVCVGLEAWMAKRQGARRHGA
jgi:glycosyltransferase 2 family protein